MGRAFSSPKRSKYNLLKTQRAVEAALRGAGDPRWSSTIGRLRLEGVIVNRQLGAAESYGKLRSRFDRAMGMPRQSAVSVFYDMGSTGRMASRELDEDELDRIRIDHARLLAEVGPLRAVLDRVVLFDDAPLPGELPRLKAGLDLLVALVQDRGGVMAGKAVFGVEGKASSFHGPACLRATSTEPWKGSDPAAYHYRAIHVAAGVATAEGPVSLPREG